MGKHLVKAKTICRITDDNGVTHVYRPGDWFEVRNQTLRQLLANGQIEQPCDVSRAYDLSECGVIVTGGSVDEARQTLQAAGLRDIEVRAGAFSLEFDRTLFWDTSANLRHDLIAVGFARLATGWQVAAPLCRYKILASTLGTPEERAQTEAIIHDLRVPVYDHRVLFVRKSNDTANFMQAFNAEPGERRLALMRAIYQTLPVLCALPTTWIK